MSVLSAAALAGCGGESEQPQAAPAAPETPAAPAAPVAKQPGAAKAPQVVVSNELPADFPADVPRYPGAEIRTSRAASKFGMAVVMSTTDPVEKVFPFLADSLAAEGWSTEIREAPKGKMILADKGERTVMTHVVGAKDGTRIRVLITQFAR